jgi:hypothetical protein
MLKMNNDVSAGLNKMSTYEDLAVGIGKMVTEKNKIYGESYMKSSSIMKILYPGGIKPESYIDALTIIRILDKLSRLSESKCDTEDPYSDIAGYAILRLSLKNIKQ